MKIFSAALMLLCGFTLEASRQTVEVQRQRYQDLFEFAPDAYLVTDIEGTIWEANRAAAPRGGSDPSARAGPASRGVSRSPGDLFGLEDPADGRRTGLISAAAHSEKRNHRPRLFA